VIENHNSDSILANPLELENQQYPQTPLMPLTEKMSGSDDQDGKSHRSADENYEADKTVIIENEKYQTIVQEKTSEHRRRKTEIDFKEHQEKH